jgi:hypothetical protein
MLSMLVGLGLAGTLIHSARAADGTIEINQQRALAGGVTPGDAPGFPVEIFTAGSFVLTGDLAVPGAADAGIAVYAAGTRIDLNGFSISSLTTCSGLPPTCTLAGAGVGIAASGASDVSVRHGRVRGFRVHGVELFDSSRVEEMTVESNGQGGIVCDEGCVVEDSIVRRNGGGGIEAGLASRIARNVVSRNAGPGISAPLNAVSDRNAVSHNVGTSVAGARFRRFYVTQSSVNGANALSACGPGFHMASLWEIHEPSSLQYDASLGGGAPDLGLGAPSDYLAWVRTGANTQDPEPGAKHCNQWTTASAGSSGTLVMLTDNWLATNTATWPWIAVVEPCSSSRPVWCVED